MPDQYQAREAAKKSEIAVLLEACEPWIAWRSTQVRQWCASVARGLRGRTAPIGDPVQPMPRAIDDDRVRIALVIHDLELVPHRLQRLTGRLGPSSALEE